MCCKYKNSVNKSYKMMPILSHSINIFLYSCKLAKGRKGRPGVPRRFFTPRPYIQGDVYLFS